MENYGYYRDDGERFRSSGHPSYPSAELGDSEAPARSTKGNWIRPPARRNAIRIDWEGLNAKISLIGPHRADRNIDFLRSSGRSRRSQNREHDRLGAIPWQSIL